MDNNLQIELDRKSELLSDLNQKNSELKSKIDREVMKNKKLIEDLETLEKVIESKRLERLNMSEKERFIYSTLKDDE